MKLISFEKLYTTDFFISESLVKPQYWQGRGGHCPYSYPLRLHEVLGCRHRRLH